MNISLLIDKQKNYQLSDFTISLHKWTIRMYYLLFPIDSTIMSHFMTLDCRIYFYVQLDRIYILRYDRRFAYQSRLFKLLNTETAFRIISTPKL